MQSRLSQGLQLAVRHQWSQLRTGLHLPVGEIMLAILFLLVVFVGLSLIAVVAIAAAIIGAVVEELDSHVW